MGGNWDTSKLIHDGVYSVTVRAYDGDDYSQDVVWRMTINNPLDAENIDPVFNETGWVGTWTIFCDQNSNSFDRCGGGVSFDLAEFFSDQTARDRPAMTSSSMSTTTTRPSKTTSTTISSITPLGVLTYDPMSYMAQTTSSIPDWSSTAWLSTLRTTKNPRLTR